MFILQLKILRRNRKAYHNNVLNKSKILAIEIINAGSHKQEINK